MVEGYRHSLPLVECVFSLSLSLSLSLSRAISVVL